MSCCSCCGKTGACCLDGVCTEETCQDCLDAGGTFQGVDTECVGEDECPCDPPADPSLCQKCVDGEVVGYCPEDKPNCCDGVCQAECDLGACCADDGTCSQTTEEGCDGTWQGVDTLCDDYDCESGCCETITLFGCLVAQCVRGYNADTCVTECDPTADAVGPTTDCDGGTPTQVTVTGAGYINVNTGVPADDAAIEAAINDSYVIDLNCAASGSEQFDLGDFFVIVSVGLSNSRSASISVYRESPLAQVASMTLQGGAETPTSTTCGHSLYPCSDFSGTVTSFGGSGDGSAATIDVQGM